MTEPLPAGWYTWRDSPQSDHLIAHWFGDFMLGALWAICTTVVVWPIEAKPATFQRHCKLCERVLVKETKKA